MIRLLILLLFPVMAYSQAWVKTPDGMKKLGMTTTTGDTAVVEATASVDSALYVTKTNLDSVKANRALSGHTHSGLAPTGGSSGQVLTKSSATNYDYAWATPSGGAYWTDLRRTAADTTNSSNTTLTKIGGLQFTAASATRYEFEFFVRFSAGAATTTGIVLAVNVSSAPTEINYVAAIPVAADGTAGMFHGWGTASDDVVIGTGVQATNTVYVARVFGYVLTNSAATISLCFRSEINASAVTVKTNSFGRYRTIP